MQIEIKIEKNSALITYGKSSLSLSKDYSVNKDKPFILPELETSAYLLKKFDGNKHHVIYYLLNKISKRKLRKLYYFTFSECSDTYIKPAIYKALQSKREIQ